MNNTNINYHAQCLDNMLPGMVYVPWQFFKEVYPPDKALIRGTIFPCLDKPFLGGCSR